MSRSGSIHSVFTSVGSWEKVKRQSSRSRERVTSPASRDGSLTRDAWGGEPDAESQRSQSVASSSFGPDTHLESDDLYTQLPWDNVDKKLEEEYTLFVTGNEVGLSMLYAESHGGVVVPQYAGDNDVICIWIFDSTELLWKRKTMGQWDLVIREWLKRSATSLCNRIHAYWQRAQDAFIGASKLAKMRAKAHAMKWAQVDRKAVAALTSIGKVATLRNVAVKAAVLLRDDALVDRLDSDPDILSFQNGVVDLPTATLRPRTAEDMLTYVLPYEYDVDADVSDFAEFVSEMFEPDADALTAIQSLMGYWMTGRTTQKHFTHFSSQPHSGKTTLMTIICNAAQDYGAMDLINIEEMRSGNEHQDDMAKLLSRKPRLRFHVWDESNRDFAPHERLLNQMTCGMQPIQLTLAIKHRSSDCAVLSQAKLIWSTNHSFKISSESLGTAARYEAIDLKYSFPPDYVDGSGAGMKRPNNDLKERLTSALARPGIMRYLIECSRQFYSSNRLPSCMAWKGKTFEMLCQADVALRWLTKTYIPTGNDADRVSMRVLLEDFSKEYKFVREPARQLTSAFQFMLSYVTVTEWAEPAPFYNTSIPSKDHPVVLVQGVKGLRPRLSGDTSFFESIDAAKDTARLSRIV